MRASFATNCWCHCRGFQSVVSPKTMSDMVPQLLIWSAATQAFAVGSSCSWPRSAKERLRDLSGDGEATGNDPSQTLDERPSTLYMSGASRPTRVHRVDAIASLW
ncbi:hypothetical protein, variant [Cladophialophora immunda]|uniref:Uncharacterized protein n=1 Tax=Cladophialophora immunda TaxID=569365 RepID=A0A0D2CQV4_9EURO|nr:uncharacterized protein PV07_00412 [Cladophialophora immunda]XP_016253790.1 hypothetical protein, variant [Cladophialophora immunda]KIW33573.1 hypothetical protein PV07_00412 [Cladophialophora immunda]KIW33574.1 hypothetical protein, variant [Cladophialophora immunda]